MTGPGICSLSTLVILPVFCERGFNFEVLRPRCHLLLFYEPRESPFLKDEKMPIALDGWGLEFAHVHCLIALVVSLSTLSNAYALIILQE